MKVLFPLRLKASAFGSAEKLPVKFLWIRQLNNHLTLFKSNIFQTPHKISFSPAKQVVTQKGPPLSGRTFYLNQCYGKRIYTP